MARFTWSHASRLRPDPYEDWRKQTGPQTQAQAEAPPQAPPARADESGFDSSQVFARDSGWVPVTLELVVDPVDPRGSALAHLDWILGRLKGKIADAPEIRAKDRFHRKLAAIRAEIERDGDTADVFDRMIVFKAYMPESDVFANGKEKTYEAIRFRFTGPSIERILTSFSLGTTEKNTERNREPVVIGIIDDGLAFANSRFCTQPPGSGPLETRFEALWLQDVETVDASGIEVDYGRRLRKAEINQLLSAEFDPVSRTTNERAIYRSREVGMEPDREEHMTVHRAASHGCHILDLAAGEDPGDMRSDRPIIGVQLPTVVTAQTSGRTLAHYAIYALYFIFDEADKLGTDHKLPVVVNFSYGFQAGAKNGNSAIEVEIDRLVQERNEEAQTIVVLPAGNAHDDGTNAVFELDPGDTETLEWIISPDDHTESFAEMHLRSKDTPSAEISIAPPGGEPAAKLSSPDKDPVVLSDGSGKVAALYLDGPEHLKDMSRMRAIAAINRTTIREADSTLKAAPSGRWTIFVHNTGETPLLVHAMIQRDDTLTGYRLGGRQSVWDHKTAHQRSPKTGDYTYTPADAPLTGRGTLSALSGGTSAVVVGAADDGALVPDWHGAGASDTDQRAPTPSPYTSAGLRHELSDMRTRPHMSVPVDHGPVLTGLLASGTISGSLASLSGTSVAAPLMTRALADLLSGGSPINGPVATPAGATVFANDAAPTGVSTASPGPETEARLGAFTLTRTDGGHWQNNARVKRSRT